MPERNTNIFIKLKINGQEIGQRNILGFEWKSFVNGGYIIRAKIADPGGRLLRSKGIDLEYLKTARDVGFEIKFQIGYFKLNQSRERMAILTDLDVYGNPVTPLVEFVAIDPASYYLNQGLGDGKIYTGKISDVIEQVLVEYAPNISEREITPTNDDPNGKWAMMRQDPKTFIQSMLDWSSSVTPSKTNWIVVSDDQKIIIKELKDMLSNRKHFADYNVSMSSKMRNDIYDYNFLNDSILGSFQNAIITQGISTTSGKLLDRMIEKRKTEVRDETTSNKVNAKVSSHEAFNKPQCKWATAITAIPELSGGELGVKYEDWIDGRARNLFITMLPMIMRGRFTVNGDPQYDNSSNLGVSTIKINWLDVDDQRYFLSGRWIVYGFHHRFQKGKNWNWWTDLYAYRIDHNANVSARL